MAAECRRSGLGDLRFENVSWRGGILLALLSRLAPMVLTIVSSHTVKETVVPRVLRKVLY